MLKNIIKSKYRVRVGNLKSSGMTLEQFKEQQERERIKQQQAKDAQNDTKRD
jgi:hypothetical protein